MRDNFTETTKRILAQRVCYHCSNPTCLAITAGPNSDSNKSTIVGQAAHISAASFGGPRFEVNMDSEERSSIENGIWLCYTCSKLIDSDPEKYTIEILKEWKTQSEGIYLKQIGKSGHVSKEELPFIEMDIIWNNSGRYPQGYSDKNFMEGEERIIDFRKSYLMYFELRWRLSFVLYNNSNFSAYNVSFKHIRGKSIDSISKLNQINNIAPLDKIDLGVKYSSLMECYPIDTEALLKPRIPKIIFGSAFEISYLNEKRNLFKTMVEIDDSGILKNTKI